MLQIHSIRLLRPKMLEEGCISARFGSDRFALARFLCRPPGWRGRHKFLTAMLVRGRMDGRVKGWEGKDQG